MAASPSRIASATSNAAKGCAFSSTAMRRVCRRRRRPGIAQPERIARLLTGGTLHVILTTVSASPPARRRSSTYATAVAKMLPVPIFHVNGEYLQSVARVVELAMDPPSVPRCFIDLYSFRRLGHNSRRTGAHPAPLSSDRAPSNRSRQFRTCSPRQSDRGEAYANRRDRTRRSRKQFNEETSPPAEQTRPPVSGNPISVVVNLMMAPRRARSCRTAKASLNARAHPEGFISTKAAKQLSRQKMAKGEELLIGPPPTPRLHRWPSKVIRCASPARFRNAARSASATPCCTTRRQPNTAFQPPVMVSSRRHITVPCETGTMGF